MQLTESVKPEGKTGEGEGKAVTECRAPPTVLRTRIYRAKWTLALDAALTRCRHVQRGVYNRTIADIAPQGGSVPAKQKSPAHPDGLSGRLTEWRSETPSMGNVPVVLARPAVGQARTALKLHEDATRARVARVLGEDASWKKWMSKHLDWDAGAWDGLDIEDKRKAVKDKRKAVKENRAPPKSAATWRDERSGDGARTQLLRRRKTKGRCAVVWDTPPRRVDANTVGLVGLGEVEVVANNPLPEAARLRAAKVCVKHGSRGRTRVEVHLAVLVDVVPRTKRRRQTPLVAGADMGCADTLTMHNGRTITLPDHTVGMDVVLDAQRAMNKCVQGSRQWHEHLEQLRSEKAAMRSRDRDAIRKAAKDFAAMFDVLGLESLNITGMGASARGRAWAGVAAKRGLNRSIRSALWGFTQDTLKAALEARGGTVLKLPAMDSSTTCAACGHVDAKSRDKRRFECTACEHKANADVNAGQVLRARALRWLALKAQGLTDGAAKNALWGELRTARKRCAGQAGAENQARARDHGRTAVQRRCGCTVDSACTGSTDAFGQPMLERRRTRRRA